MGKTIETEFNAIGNPSVIVWTQLQSTKLRYEYMTEQGKQEATLMFAFKNGFPRIVVYPEKYKPDQDNKVYTIPFDIQMMKIMGKLITSASNSQSKQSTSITCRNIDYNSEDRRIIDVGTIRVAVKEMYVSLEVLIEDKHYSFPIEFPKDWFRIKKDGEDVTETNGVNITYAKVYGETLISLADNYYTQYAFAHLTQKREPSR